MQALAMQRAAEEKAAREAHLRLLEAERQAGAHRRQEEARRLDLERQAEQAAR